MLKRVLVANRGEIAVRIIRACRDLGLESVAVYSEVDRGGAHVGMADRAVCIGPRRSADSYLNIPALVTTALLTGCQAVHPGYGFLAENEDFAAACEQAGLIFIGPRPDAIRLMGDKALARRTASDLGVPVIPGSQGTVRDGEELAKLAAEIGYPLLLKAAAGGGGRGMRLVRAPDELQAAYQRARAESGAAFGNGDLYLERFLERVRHVEVQVLCDGASTCVHLGERECSLQRRHQKVLEEAPSPVLDPATREQMTGAALAICRHINYRGAGTLEFMLDEAERRFYFMEMNTRLQVEHPVTELLTGVDLVAEQLRIAADEGISFRQEEVALRGHAIECRINAEDPDADFRPNPGTLKQYRQPAGPGVRVDSHCYPGYIVPPDYDSLLAKIVAYGRDRDEAIRRMQRALAEYEVAGIATTIPFHQRLLADPDFRAGRFHTKWLENSFMVGSVQR